LRQRESETKKPIDLGIVPSYYTIAVPTLDKEVARADRLKKNPANPEPEPEAAEFKLTWLTAPGTPVLFAAVLSMVLLRMSAAQIQAVIRKTFVQMKIRFRRSRS